MRGRKPKPTALKLLDGNPGKRPINKREPKPAPKAPGCPTWLPVEAKAEWRRVVPELDRIGMLSKVDRGALATYCCAWARLVEAERLIGLHGQVVLAEEMTLVGDDEVRYRIYVRPTKNPALQVAKESSAIIRAFCSEFGLTPSSRARMTLPDVAGDGDLESLLS